MNTGTQNVLKQAEVIKLSMWLAENRAMLATKKPTYSQAATMASESLGFPISQWNMKRLSKSAGVKWSKRQIRVVSQNVHKLLARSILEIADGLGAKLEFRDALQALSHGRRVEGEK